MQAIKAVNLTKKYKELTAVDNLNLEINKGEFKTSAACLPLRPAG